MDNIAMARGVRTCSMSSSFDLYSVAILYTLVVLLCSSTTIMSKVAILYAVYLQTPDLPW